MVGGIKSAFHPNGAYMDLPVHKQCGEYALEVCPHLASKSYNSKLTIEKLQENLDGENISLVDHTQDPVRPSVFVFIKISDYMWHFTGGVNDPIYIITNKPYESIYFWNNGKCISANEALLQMNEDDQNLYFEFMKITK